jgi:hypothetical protein
MAAEPACACARFIGKEHADRGTRSDDIVNHRRRPGLALGLSETEGCSQCLSAPGLSLEDHRHSIEQVEGASVRYVIRGSKSCLPLAQSKTNEQCRCDKKRTTSPRGFYGPAIRRPTRAQLGRRQPLGHASDRARSHGLLMDPRVRSLAQVTQRRRWRRCRMMS